MHDLVELAIPAFLLLVLVEVIFDAVMRRDLYEYKDTATSLTMGIGNALVGLVAKRWSSASSPGFIALPSFLSATHGGRGSSSFSLTTSVITGSTAQVTHAVSFGHRMSYITRLNAITWVPRYGRHGPAPSCRSSSGHGCR